MASLEQLLVFVPAALLVASSPGANNLLALRNGMRVGLREAAVALTGRALAFCIMLGLTAAGLASILARSQTLFEVLKWLGVGYLAWLGLRGLLAPSAGEEDVADRPAGRFVLARQEFLTVAANPKALLLFTAFFPQFLDTSRPVAGQLLTLGPVYIGLELAAACAWAGAGHRIGVAELGARARRRMDRAIGAIFLGLAGGLATARR